MLGVPSTWDGEVTVKLLIWVSMALVAAPGCCFCPPGPSGPPSTYVSAPSAPVPAGPAIETSACAVQDSYQENEVAAAQTYPPGAHIIVTGVVDSVGVSLGDTIIHPRRCMFAMVRLREGQQSIAATLRPGDRFRADCTMGTYVLAASFDDCTVTVE